MRNFVRALKQSLKFWPSIVLATVCSFAVAALWGANIGAFYPILEVTIDGKSMHTWIDEEVAQRRDRVSELRNQSVDLLGMAEVRRAAGDLEGYEQLRRDAFGIEQELDQELAKLKGYERMVPWVKGWVPSNPFQTIALLVAVLIASTLVKHLFLIMGEVLVGRVALSVSRGLRMQVFDKAMSMDRVGFAGYGLGGFTAGITHTSDILSNALMSTLGGAMREPLKAIACLVGAGLICWRLLLLSVVIAPLVGLLLYAVTRRLRHVAKTQLEKAQNYHAVMLEGLGNIDTVQSFCMEERESNRFGEATQAVRDFGIKFVFYTSLSKPIIEFLGLGMLGTTIVGGAYLVLNQETTLLGIPICSEPLSVSVLLVFFGMLVGVSDPLRKLSAVYSSIYAGCMAADSLYGMLDRDNVIVDPKQPASLPAPHHTLELTNVSFGYDPQHPVLHDVSMRIPFGSTVAIIGENGSGKSSLIRLLNRFYDPDRGSLEFDGINFRDIRIENLRRRFALVNQHTELFDMSVADNIRYGRPDATDEQVIAAAKQAHAHEFITTRLPNGYDSLVGQNGSKLSGGQRQRIALARALICDPEVLILDEATSQIDMHSEQLIRESLEEHQGLRTLIIITHREKLLELAERVYELKQGHLSERRISSQSAA